jgi:triosephosphate isomerase
MKKLFIVANWKSHKTVMEVHSFLIAFFHKELSRWLHEGGDFHKTIVLCPPFTLLSTLKQSLLEFDHKNIKMSLGAQDISSFPAGSHTGEESSEQLSDLVDYVIVGHSERRIELQETEEMLVQKVIQAHLGGLEPIFCVQGMTNEIPKNVRIVAYEPIDAIGTGKVASLDQIENVALFYKKEKDIHYVLYGGSVTAENIAQITAIPSIDGVLVGGASLNPHEFSQIVMLS